MAFTNEEKKLLYWQLAVEGMDILNIPGDEYEAAQKRDKYDRFTTFVREFSEKLLCKANTGVEFFSDTNGLPFFQDGELKEGWWQQAVDLGRGKIPKNSVLPVIYEPSEETVKAVYNTFMPAYRALTESFAKRSIFQWIFNHAQYTAERDAIRGLRGLMMCLTAKTSEELKPQLDNYREKGPSVVRTFEQRKALLARMRNGEEVNAYEDEVFVMPENINERMQDSENVSVNESEIPDNQAVIENNNILENNNDLENEQVVFNPDDIENSFSLKSNDVFENDDVEEIQGMVNNININEPVLDISVNDDDSDIGEDVENSFGKDDDNKPSDEISNISNSQINDNLDAQDNEEIQEVRQEYRPTARILYERATKPAEFKSEAVAFIRELLKGYNAPEELIHTVYDQATDQCLDICISYDSNIVHDKDGAVGVLSNTASSTFSLIQYTLRDYALNIVDSLVVSQKLTDYFIHKLTPIGFHSDEYGKYGENFMSNYRDEITNNLVNNYEESDISREDCEKAMDDAIKALGGNAPQIEGKEDVNKNEAVNNEDNNDNNEDNNNDNNEVNENEKEAEKSIVSEAIVEESIVENHEEEPIVEEPIVEEPIVAAMSSDEAAPIIQEIHDQPIEDNRQAEENKNEEAELEEQNNEFNNEVNENENEAEKSIVSEAIVEESIVENHEEEPIVEEPIVEAMPSAAEAAPIIQEIQDQPVEDNKQAEENKNEEAEIEEQNNEFNLFDYDSAAPATGAALNAEGVQNNEFNLFDHDAAQPAQTKQDNLVEKPEEKSEELLFDKPVGDEPEPEPEEEKKNEPEQVENQEPQDYYHNPNIYVPILEYITTYYETDLNVEGEKKENIKDEISNTLSNSGMGEDDVAEFIKNIDAIIVGMDLALIGDRVTEEEDAVPAMEHMVMESYKLSYSLLEENNFGSNVKERAEMAQKVADMLLKNYSPVALANGAMDKYANRYLFTSRTLTKEFLLTFVKDLNELNELTFQLTGKRVAMPQPAQQPVQPEQPIQQPVDHENEVKEENKVEAPVVDDPENDEEIAKAFVGNILNNVQVENEEEGKEQPKEEAEEQPKEEVEEEPQEEAEELKPVSNSKKINDVLKEKCERRIRDADTAVANRQQLFKIFRDPSFENEKLITAINIANEIPQSIANQFEKARYDLITNQGVERMMKSVFSEAFSCTEECGFDLAFRIGVAQRITDLMMKDYSLVAIVPYEFDTYADNYIVLHKGILNELIKDHTKDLSEEEVSDLMKRVDKEMAPDLIGWNARNFEHVYGRELLPYEKLYQNIMGEQAPELKPVSMETYRGYQEQYEERLKDAELTKSVKEQMAKIYAESGVDESRIDAAVNKAFDKLVDITTKTYKDLQNVTDYLKTAKDMMVVTVQHTLDWVHPHVPVEGLPERIVIGQKISDVFLKNYSPVAFVNGDLDKFSDNYICSNNERIESWLTGCNVITKDRIHEIPGIINGVEKLMNRAMVVVEEEVYEEPAEEIDDDDIDDLEEEIEEKKNDVPAHEENNVDAQKERMVIPELSENIAGKDGYPKVDEDAASAVSDKQI